MPRRILYNPVEFVEASMPFYDNIIGMITDQTDRISRNIEMAREENRIAEDREWQEGMLEKQLGARRELSQEQMEHQSRESSIDRQQRQTQFHGGQRLAYDQLALDWAKLIGSEEQARIKAGNQEVTDAQTFLNKTDDKIRNAGMGSVDAPLRRTVLPNPQTGELTVLDTFNKNENGQPAVLGGYDQYMERVTPIVNFIDTELGGRNARDWGRDRLKFGEYVTPNDDVDYIDGHRWNDILAEFNSGQASQATINTLEALVRKDPSVQFLYKEGYEDFLEMGDQREVNYRVHNNMDVLTNANNYLPLFSENMKRFGGDLRSFWSSEGTRDNVEKLMPIPFDMEFRNLPGVEFKGQTIGQMENRWMNLRAQYGTETPDEIKLIGQAVQDTRKLIIDILDTYGDEIIPEHLKGVDPFKLARSVRLNKEAIQSNHIVLKNIIDFPDSIEEVEQQQDPTEDGAEGPNFLSGFRYGLNNIPMIFPGL